MMSDVDTMEQWELEYQRLFGEGFGNHTMRETSKAAFEAGWFAAIEAVITKLEEENGKGNR